MLLPRNSQKVDDTSVDAIEPTLSNMRQTLHTMLPSTLFRFDPSPSSLSSLFNRSDSAPLDSKKTDKKPVGQFL